MQYFKTSKPPKSLKISELCLPRVNYFTRKYEIYVPNPHNSLSMISLRNFNKFSLRQLIEYKQVMFKKWGDITLTLRYSGPYHCEYTAVYASKYRNMLKASDLGIARSLESMGNND